MDTTKNKKSEDFKITGNWEKQSKQLAKKFSQLTKADLKLESGKDNELLERIETRLNKNRAEVINLIKNCQPVEVRADLAKWIV
jgi:phosphoserine aminotransferase